MEVDYRASHSHEGKGASYDATFLHHPYRSMVWRFEKQVLERVIKALPAYGQVRQLDFACGTGRILRHCSSLVQSSTGVDISASMLSVAREKSNGLEFHEADLTRQDVLEDRKFDVVTAFRFFPNAQPELRKQAMEVLVRHLADNGRIVFNNHKNTGSTRNRIARMLGRRSYQGMSVDDVRELISLGGLEIEQTFHYCVFPASERYPILPPAFLSPIEDAFSKWGFLRDFGENVIYVCRRRQQPQGSSTTPCP